MNATVAMIVTDEMNTANVRGNERGKERGNETASASGIGTGSARGTGIEIERGMTEIGGNGGPVQRAGGVLGW